ncbi:MAG TPA: hypothetical protein VF608_14170 [Thermoanaerobaculia bacterium]
MRILFDDGVCEDVEAEPVDAIRYRLLWSPLSSSTNAKLGDVVELTPEGEIWRFVRIAEASPLETMQMVLSRELAESSAFHDLLNFVRDIGGEWEKAFGGIVFLHFPPASGDEVRARLDRLESVS